MLSQRIFALICTGGLALAPALGPAAPVAAIVFRVGPTVREIVGRLHRVDLPARRRNSNWTGRRGEGSCVHASLVHLLHWQGRHDLAELWLRRFADGETAAGLAGKLDAAGIPYAETRQGDETFLDWALRTRRGVNVVVQNGAHMVTLAALDRDSAWVLDSNRPDRLQQLARSAFLADWKRSGGWAVTPVGTPPPPAPWLVRPRS